MFKVRILGLVTGPALPGAPDDPWNLARNRPFRDGHHSGLIMA
jgi:hypothetical protein